MTLKQLAPIKVGKELPATFSVGMVDVPDKGGKWYAVVISQIQGNEVIHRKLWVQSESRGEAVDELHRLIERIFTFGEGKDLIEAD